MSWYLALNSTGLLLDIIGVLLLFRYGLPSKVEKDLYYEERDPEFGTEAWRKNKRIIQRANLGLTLLIIGFIFQLIAVWIN